MKKIFFTTLLLISYFCTHAQSLSNTTWTNYLLDGSSFNVRLSLDTLYTNAADGINYESIATYEVDGNNFTIQDIASIGCPPDDIGSYTFIIENDTLNFTLLNDPCEGRSFAIGEGIWVRIPEPILYVNQDATGANDGSSWENAYTSLHDALENYNENDEIWVAAGTYLPENPSEWSDDIKQTFYIHQNVNIYGGFDGTETALDQREPVTNVTILSGDIDGDDVVDDFETNREDNVINVVYIDSTSTNTILDGFTISGGHAEGLDSIITDVSGAGIFSFGKAKISNCTIQQNFAMRQGGGVQFRFAKSAGSILENCLVKNNQSGLIAGGLTLWETTNITINACQFIANYAAASAGGAIAMGMSSAIMSNCEFKENSSTFSAGALFFDNFTATDLELTISDCNFENNASVHGGAFVFASAGGGDCNIRLSGCEFKGNTAISAQAGDFPDGGAIEFEYYNGNPSNDTLIVMDCILENNSAERQGGGLAFYNFFGSENYFEVNNCQFLGNTSGSSAGGYFLGNYGGSNMDAKVIDCSFENNTSNHGGGMYYLSSTGTDNNLLFQNCEFKSNNAVTSTTSFYPDGAGLGFQYVQGNPTNDTIMIIDCLVENNTAERQGGGLAFYNSFGSENYFEVSNSQFIENSSIDAGAGLFLSNLGANNMEVKITGSVFENNTAEGVGGGIQVNNVEGAGNQLTLSDCDFLNNHSDVFGGGFRIESQVPQANLTVEDCLFDGNTATIDGGGMEVVHFEQSESDVTIHHTDFINNHSGNEGAGLNFYVQDEAGGSLLVEGAVFSGNTNDATGNAVEGAGGFSLNNFGTGIAKIELQSSIFENNSSEDGAGAIQLYKIGTSSADEVLLENCLLNNNRGGDFAGGIGMDGAIELTVKSTTIADNTNGGISIQNGNIAMQNTILHNPDASNFLSASTDNASSLGGNLVSDNTMDSFLGNTDQSNTNPLFSEGSFQLPESSPAVDAGVVPDNLPLTDLAGNERIQGGCIDIGAIESAFDAGTACVTGTKEVIVENGNLSIFPNPVANLTTISMDNDWQGTFQLRMVNALGQEVMSRTITKTAALDQWQMDVSDFAVGIYQVLISDGERMMVEKFSKMQP